MGVRYLLDSNVIVFGGYVPSENHLTKTTTPPFMAGLLFIGFLANKMPVAGMRFVADIVDEGPHVSVISKIEVLRFRDTPENEAVLADFINRSAICPLNHAAVDRTIGLCRQSRIKLPDAIIAATALAGNFVLVTRNTTDFKNITGIEIINPWEIG